MDLAYLFANKNWLAVIVAALAGFPLGMVWYGVLFKQPWMAATGVTEADAKRMNPAKVYPLVLLLNFIAALCLAALLGKAGLVAGLQLGLLVGVGFVATTLAVGMLFELRKFAHWAINAGYQVVFFVVAGAILGAWR
jgi:hypothetical protein